MGGWVSWSYKVKTGLCGVLILVLRDLQVLSPTCTRIPGHLESSFYGIFRNWVILKLSHPLAD
jgi:hypothetical protein